MDLTDEDLAFADRSLDSAEATLRQAVNRALARYGRNEWDGPILDAAELIFRRAFRERTGTNKSDGIDAAVAAMRAEIHALVTTPTGPPKSGAADIISRVVAAAAFHAGQDFAMQELGEHDVARVWTTMQDDRVRASHAHTHGQRRTLGQRFLVGPDGSGKFAAMRYPGDPTVPISFWARDRCILRPVSSARTAAMQQSDMLDPDALDETGDPEPVDMGDPDLDPSPCFCVLVVEGTPTGDRRMFSHGAITWPELPITLAWQKPNEKGHDSSVVVGRIDQIWREGTAIMGAGVFADSPEADEVIGLIADKMVRGISVDPDDFNVAEFAVGDGGDPGTLFTKARLRGATLVAIPAFVEAYIGLGHPENAAAPIAASLAFKIDEGKWDGSESNYSLEQWKRATLIDTGEGAPFMKSRYKLPIRTPEGDLSRAGVHAAAGRLNQTDAPKDEIAKAKRALRSAYRELKEDPPDSIAASVAAEFNRGPGWITEPKPTARIWKYWTKPGEPGFAKIRWGVPGDFNRCRRHLAKYVKPEFLNRTCAQWHHDAIGVWPGRESGKHAHGHFATDGCEDCMDTDTLAASAATISHRADFFENPGFVMKSPLVVSKEGRVMAHLATFDQCHLGIGDRCVTAPRSKTNYAYFKLGAVLTDEGEIPVGHISLGGGHATLDKGFRATVEHYDSTSAVVADVTCGEDKFGIWVSGQLRPGVTDAQIAALRAAPLSGDWRTIGGNRELVAALSVNTPGFAIPRVGFTLTASGEVEALTAVGVVEPSGGDYALVASAIVDEMERRSIRRRMDTLRMERNRQKMAALSASAQGPGCVLPEPGPTEGVTVIACACGKGKDGKTYQYIVTDQYGQQKTFGTEIEARAYAGRTKGAMQTRELARA